VLFGNTALAEYRKTVKENNEAIVNKWNRFSKQAIQRNYDLSDLFMRAIDRVNKNYRKSNETIIKEISDVTGFSIERFNGFILPNVEFSPYVCETRILEWLLSYDIKYFPEELKIDYKER